MEFSQCVAKVCRELRQPSIQKMKQALLSIECTPERIAPYITEPGRLPYGRNVIFRSEDVEAIVIHLPAGAETYIHDHGSSIGCGLVVAGEMINAMYRPEGYGMASSVKEVLIREGQCFYAPPGQIHQMKNAASDRLVSLHLYAPPLKNARTYRSADDHVLDYVI
jgi:cysteine dioxygenase